MNDLAGLARRLLDVLDFSELAGRLRPFLVNVSNRATRAVLGNQILLYHGQADAQAFDASADGLAAALTAAVSGDGVVLPACSITGGAWTIPSGVTLRGLGWGSLLTGAVTNNGSLIDVQVAGTITQGAAGAYCLRVLNTTTSGNGFVMSAGLLSGCVAKITSGGYSYSVTGGRLLNCVATDEGSGAGGIFCDGAQVVMVGCRFGGNNGALVRDAYLITNCQFEGSGAYGFKHDSGSAKVQACSFISVSAYGLEVTASGLTLCDCYWNSMSGLANVTFGTGDRGGLGLANVWTAGQEIRTTSLPQLVLVYDDTHKMMTSVASDGTVTQELLGSGVLSIHHEGTERVGLVLQSYGDTAQPNAIVSRRARGSKASPSPSLANDILFSFGGEGFVTGDFTGNNHAAIQILAAENFSSTNQGSYIRFQTVPKASGFTRPTRGIIDDAGRWGIGHTTPTNIATKLDVTQTDAGTNDVQAVATVDRQSSGTPAAGFGERVQLLLESSTTIRQLAGAMDAIWTTATHASRTSKLVLSIVISAVETSVLELTSTAIVANKPIQPPHLADASAPNDSIYYSTTANRLVYKDSGGTVNNLY